MKISIIIPIYNGSSLVLRCLDSVFSQNGSFDLEVIIIDDGSSDNSLELLSSYSRPLTILKQINQGPAAARNKGIKIATGKYLAFLDADDYWELNFLQETLSFLENNDTIAVSVGQIHKITGKEDRVMPQLIIESHDIDEKGIVLDDFYQFWTNHNHICTGSVLMRTQVVKKTGGQRAELRITEDLEFWAYLATYGQWGFIPKILFTSDGGLVTKEQGWLKKNKNRWASAPTPEEWATRIEDKISVDLSHSFMKLKGRVARNLAYSLILSNRSEKARKAVQEYNGYFPKDKLSSLMIKSAKYRFFWYFVVRIIIIKERYR